MLKASAFCRRAFFNQRHIVFKKNRLYWPSLKPFWVNLARTIMSSRPGGEKDGSQMIIPVGNQKVPTWPWRKERLAPLGTQGAHLKNYISQHPCN